VTDGFRTRDNWSHKRPSSTTNTDNQEVRTQKEDGEGPSAPLPPRFAAASDAVCNDPVEGALADGVRALAEAMRRAPADALPALAERMAVVVGELKSRREARGHEAKLGR
jgi:hypothetical protein